MSSRKTDNVQVGTVIEGISSTLLVTGVKGNTLKVVYRDDKCPHKDLRIDKVRKNHLGMWVTDSDE